MNWTNEIPHEPAYYFLNDCGEEFIVEVFLTLNGIRYMEIGTNNVTDPHCLHDAIWLGPIKSEDIINLWKSFNEDKEAWNKLSESLGKYKGRKNDFEKERKA